MSEFAHLPHLPTRPRNSHKGDYGKVLILAGSEGMSGAAILAGSSALRSGAGLVTVAVPVAIQNLVAAGNPCYMTLGIRRHEDGSLPDGATEELIDYAQNCHALALGPGLGRSAETSQLVQRLITGLPNHPIVLDADALNAIAPLSTVFHARTGPLILTPHAGEFARLTGESAPEPSKREQVAREFAKRFNIVLVLKGSGTIITDGMNAFVNPTGNPGLATGGTGDVLTGIITALLGQKLPPFDAAVLGAWIHGRAGDLGAAELGETSLIASDLLSYLPKAFREVEQRRAASS